MIFPANLMQTDQQLPTLPSQRYSHAQVHGVFPFWFYTRCTLGTISWLEFIVTIFRTAWLGTRQPMAIFAANGRSLHCFASWTYLALLYKRFLLLPRGAWRSSGGLGGLAAWTWCPFMRASPTDPEDRSQWWLALSNGAGYRMGIYIRGSITSH